MYTSYFKQTFLTFSWPKHGSLAISAWKEIMLLGNNFFFIWAAIFPSKTWNYIIEYKVYNGYWEATTTSTIMSFIEKEREESGTDRGGSHTEAVWVTHSANTKGSLGAKIAHRRCPFGVVMAGLLYPCHCQLLDEGFSRKHMNLGDAALFS